MYKNLHRGQHENYNRISFFIGLTAWSKAFLREMICEWCFSEIAYLSRLNGNCWTQDDAMSKLEYCYNRCL